MKKNKALNDRFTLIELLVVISIIALLCGLLLPAVHLVRQRAKGVKAKSLANSIALACKQYETTYSLLPVPTDTTKDQVILSDSEFDELIQILTGEDGPGGSGMVGNARNQKFLDPTPSYGPGGTYFVDPWGNRFKVVMDCDYSGGVSSPFSKKGKIFVWSIGPNKVDDHGGTTGSADDITSW